MNRAVEASRGICQTRDSSSSSDTVEPDLRDGYRKRRNSLTEITAGENKQSLTKRANGQVMQLCRDLETPMLDLLMTRHGRFLPFEFRRVPKPRADFNSFLGVPRLVLA